MVIIPKYSNRDILYLKNNKINVKPNPNYPFKLSPQENTYPVSTILIYILNWSNKMNNQLHMKLEIFLASSKTLLG